MYRPNNESVPMTRRYPDLKQKVLQRDSKIVKQLMKSWESQHDRDAFLKLFLQKMNNLSDQRYWELLRTVWILSGGLDSIKTFRKLLKSNRKHQYYFSTPEEQERFRNMDENFIVYRACNDDNDGGISWTLYKAYAEQYKIDFNKEKVIEQTVNKEDVYAIIERNKEEEIIIL